MAAKRPIQQSAAQATLILKEQRRRSIAKSTLLDSAFKEQRAFIEDPSRFKAAVCTRRAGKSYGIGLYLVREALLNPGVNCLYLARSSGSAKNIMMKDVFRHLDQKFDLGIKYNFAALTLEFPNGSVIKIAGADAHSGQIHTVVGVKYKLVVIDEAQYWTKHLESIVYEGLEAALSDQRGTICIVGVPSSYRGFFYDVTTSQRDLKTGELRYPEWSNHKWSAFDNPHQVKQWKMDIAAKIKINPGIVNSPVFRQQWLGEWADDPDARCYRFDADVNRIDALPGLHSDYYWLLGVDVGFKPDPMAYVVCAYRKDNTDQCLYVVHTHKQNEMLMDSIGEYVEYLKTRFPLDQFVIDPKNSNVFAELTRRLGIPFQKAEQAGKSDFIHMVTDDLKSARIKLVGDAADDLASEWEKLVWDDRNKARIVPLSGCDDHLSDAFLYAWRHAYHYLKPQQGEVLPLNANSDGWMEQYEKRLQARAQNSGDPVDALDREFNDRPTRSSLQDAIDDLLR